MWNASDEALVAGLGVGDTDVARVLVRRFQGRVPTGWPCRSSAIAPLQRRWRKTPSYGVAMTRRASTRARGSAAAWLLAIARNASLDYVRARGRRLEHLPLEPLDAFPDLADTDQILSPHDAIAPVASAVRALPKEQRDTLMAVAYYGFTTKEISDAWNVPLGTVKSRLRLALFKLRDEFTEIPS